MSSCQDLRQDIKYILDGHIKGTVAEAERLRTRGGNVAAKARLKMDQLDATVESLRCLPTGSLCALQSGQAVLDTLAEAYASCLGRCEW